MMRQIIADCHEEVLRENLAQAVGKVLLKGKEATLSEEQLTGIVADVFEVDSACAEQIVTVSLRKYKEAN